MRAGHQLVHAPQASADFPGYVHYDEREGLEVILVDDASTDRSLEIAEDYDCRVIRMEKNSGPSTARNRGANEAKGEILFFTDSDVITMPDTMEKIAKVEKQRLETNEFRENPN